MKGGEGVKGKITALNVLLYGVGVGGVKQIGWGGGRRADQAKNENGQSIEGMRKNMLFFCKWHRQSSWLVLWYNKVVLQFSSH